MQRSLAVERDGQRRQRQVRRCGGGRAAGGSRAPRSAATPRRRGRPRPARPGRPRRSVGRARPPRPLCAAVPRAAPQARRGWPHGPGSYGIEDRRRAREARPRCRSLGTAGRCRPRSSARRPAWRTPGTARPSGSAFRRASGSSRPRGSRRAWYADVADRRLVQRHVDHAAFARALALEQRRQHAQRRPRPGSLVDERRSDADTRRGPARR